MAIKAATRRTEQGFGDTPVCKFWLSGRCNRNPCRFLHSLTPSAPTHRYDANTPYKYVRKPTDYYHANNANKYIRKPQSSLRKSINYDSKAVNSHSSVEERKKNDPMEVSDEKTGGRRMIQRMENDPMEVSDEKTGGRRMIQRKENDQMEVSDAADETTIAQAPQKPSLSICKYWMNDNCVHGDKCSNLHSWSSGDRISTLAKLHEHKKVITGIALPDGSDKLYSGSTDGTLRTWDCNTGLCVNVVNLGSEVTSLISEGPWVFIGVKNAVKAWNVQTASEFTLDGPKGQVKNMIFDNDTLFAGAEDGVIYAWRGSSDPEAKSPFELVASLCGHTKAVSCLTIGRKKLYSGSMDHTIKVWDLDTLECKMTLTGHADKVTSLICWDHYLLSSSIDCTLNIWGCIEEGTLDVIYTHTEESGILALSGMTDSEAKHILFVSCKDNSVRMYELPSFLERGRLFARQNVHSLGIGPAGLFFTGDETGLLVVWKWLEEPNVSSS